MTSIRIDGEVIFQVKSRRDPITQSLWRSYAEKFLHQNAPLRTAIAGRSDLDIPTLLQTGQDE